MTTLTLKSFTPARPSGLRRSFGIAIALSGGGVLKR